MNWDYKKQERTCAKQPESVCLSRGEYLDEQIGEILERVSGLGYTESFDDKHKEEAIRKIKALMFGEVRQ